MTSRTKLWALSAGALALSLSLAGCGGGGGSGGSPAATNTGDSGAPPLAAPAPMEVSLANVTTDGAGYTEPTATGDDPIEIEAGMSATSGSVTFECAAGEDCTVMVADDGTVTSTGGMVTAMNSTTFQAGLDEADALSKETALRDKVDDLTPIAAGAVDTAGSALKMAKDASEKIGTEASDGDSMVAMNNAAAVLKAQSDLKAAIDAAKMARKAAMDAKDALGEDGDADVIDTLEAAIEDADEAIEDAEEILSGTALAGYVAEVTGGADADPQGTPTSIGEAVAKAVAMALGPTVPEGGSPAANGAGLRVEHVSALADVNAPDNTRAADNPVAKANKYEAVSRDPGSKTWEMIVGDGVTEKAVNNVPTKVASWDSEMAALVRDRTTAIANNDGAYTTVTDGIEVSYMGIPGTAWCLGTDCEVESNTDGDKMLTGSWYFTPESMTAHYKKAADAEVYTADDLFATYGHWLVVDDSDDTSTTDVNEVGQVHVLTYAYTGTPATTNDGWLESAPGTPVSEQATYSGTAAGRSVHKVSDEDVNITEIHSSRFTAKVALTAKFGATAPMLGGRVWDFQSDNPNAVDEDWTVTLKEAAVTGGGVTAAVGVTEATGQDGTWSAVSYGGRVDDAGTTDVNEFRRPVGIYGGFNAHFTDGHVAGAYATRKD